MLARRMVARDSPDERLRAILGHMRVVGRLSPEEFWARIAQGEQQLRDSAAVLPVYRVADWAGPVLVGDWGWENGELVTAGIAHDDRTGAAVHVRTTVHDPRADVASLRMQAEGPYDPADALRRRRADAIAPGEDVAIRVDSTPVRFELWHEGDRSWAAATHAGYGLVVEGTGVAVDLLSLVRVDDIEPYLAARRQDLRLRRGET